VITAYGVAERLRRLPTAAGIGSVPVEIVRHRSLALAVTRHASPPARSREAILAHAGVCEDLMSKADAVLPVRFGEVFDDEAALRSSIDDRYDQLVGGLEHVRGRVEIGVRVRWDEAGPPSAVRTVDEAAGGRAYLLSRVAEERQRRAVERRAEAVAGRVHEAVGRHAADSRLQVLPTPGLVMSGVYLVDRDDLDRMVARVRATAQEHPELEVLCTGPWPPYSFVDLEDTRAN
jgi:Gas vesicle synthesis protein GvpL/GvpF